MNDKVIVYVGPVRFPNGGAAARRILGNALAIKSLGYQVFIASGQEKASKAFSYQGIDVHPIIERKEKNYPRWLTHLMYFSMGRNTVKWLESLHVKPKAVILYSGYSPYLLKLLPWCKRNSIPLVFDAVEWYEASHQKLGWFSPYQLNIELAMRILIAKTKNVIGISHLLSNYYSKRECNTVVVPPLLDVSGVVPKFSRAHSEKLILAYTGTPGNKDLFNHYLEAILSVDPEGRSFSFIVAGITETQLLRYPAIVDRGLKKIPHVIDCRGILTQEQAMDVVRSADFSLLLRPQQRYANAGFPTKVVESLSLGTPVIANLTSDLGMYLTDMKEGVICIDHTVSSLILALNQVMNISDNDLSSMKYHARHQAEKSFDYRNYSEIFSRFLTTVS